MYDVLSVPLKTRNKKIATNIGHSLTEVFIEV